MAIKRPLNRDPLKGSEEINNELDEQRPFPKPSEIPVIRFCSIKKNI